MKRKTNFWKGVVYILYGSVVAAIGMYIGNNDPSQELALAGFVCLLGSLACMVAGMWCIVIPRR